MGIYWIKSWSCWALVRGLIPFRSTLSCICSPFASIWSLTHFTSSALVEILSPPPPTTAALVVLPEEVGQEQGGGEGVEREDRRKKKKMAAAATERTRTGTVTTTPFGDVADIAMDFVGFSSQNWGEIEMDFNFWWCLRVLRNNEEDKCVSLKDEKKKKIWRLVFPWSYGVFTNKCELYFIFYLLWKRILKKSVVARSMSYYQAISCNKNF